MNIDITQNQEEQLYDQQVEAEFNQINHNPSNMNKLEDSGLNKKYLDQQCQVIKQDISNINQMSNQSLYLKNYNSSLLELQKVNDFSEEFIVKSQQYFQSMIIPGKKFLKELNKWILQMYQKQLQKISHQEQNAYLYMKNNIFRILIESLCIYISKGEALNIGPIKQSILNGDILKQKKLKDELFSNLKALDEICRFVEGDFLENVPNDTQYVHCFQNLWKDYVYVKRKELNLSLPLKPQNKAFLKICGWDQIQEKILAQIKQEEFYPSNILSELNQQYKLQSNLIIVQNNNYLNHQQNQNQAQTQNQNKKDLYAFQQECNQSIIQENENSSYENTSQQNHINKHINQSDSGIIIKNLQRQVKKTIKQIEKQEKNQSLEYKQSNNSQLLKINLKPEKIKVYMKQIPKNKREDIAIQVLSQLVYQDIRYQATQGLDLNLDLQEFYNLMNKHKIQDEDFQCGIQSFVQLYKTDGGKQFLLKFFDQKIKGNIDCNKHDLTILMEEMNKLKIIIKNESKRQPEKVSN